MQIKPFKIYFLTHSLLADFQEKGGICSMDAEEELFLNLYDLEKENKDIDEFLGKIDLIFGLGKKDLRRAYVRFLDYVKDRI